MGTFITAAIYFSNVESCTKLLRDHKCSNKSRMDRRFRAYYIASSIEARVFIGGGGGQKNLYIRDKCTGVRRCKRGPLTVHYKICDHPGISLLGVV